MIEHIRKYNFIIVLAILLVVVALVIGLRTDVSQSISGGHSYIKISNRTYTNLDYRKLGLDSLELINSIARSGDFEMYQFVYSLSPDAIMPGKTGDADEQFFINRMLIRQAKAEFGIHPSEEEINDYILKMRAFSSPEQKFNPDAYNRFKDNVLGRFGMSEKDFRGLISDVIATGKLRDIVGGGLGMNRDTIRQLSNLYGQKIDGALARLDIDSYRESIQPTDEELRSYWELIQDAFKTEPQRRFSYILVGPQMPAEEAAAPEPKPSIADAVMSDEAKAKAEKEKADAKAKKDAELAEIRRQKQREIDTLVDDFANALLDEKGSNFEALAAENKWEIKSTPLFTESSVPAEIDLPLRLSSRGGLAARELFSLTTTPDPVSKFSEPIGVGENQWLIVRLDEEVASRTKTYDEAAEQVRKQYVAEKAKEALKKAAEDAHEKIKGDLAAGKSFTEAAAGCGLIDVRSFEKIDSGYQPSPLTEPANLFRSAYTVDPGTLAEPIIEPTRAFLLYVAKREVTRDPKADEQVDSQLDVVANQNLMSVFGDWLLARAEAGRIERLYRK